MGFLLPSSSWLLKLPIVVSIISCFGIKSLKGKDITFKISLECLLSLSTKDVRKMGIR